MPGDAFPPHLDPPSALKDLDPDVREKILALNKAAELHQMRRAPIPEPWRYQLAFNILIWELLKLLDQHDLDEDKESLPRYAVISAMAKAQGELT